MEIQHLAQHGYVSETTNIPIKVKVCNWRFLVYTLQQIIFAKVLILFNASVYMFVDVFAPQCACGNLRTASTNWFSPSSIFQASN